LNGCMDIIHDANYRLLHASRPLRALASGRTFISSGGRIQLHYRGELDISSAPRRALRASSAAAFVRCLPACGRACSCPYAFTATVPSSAYHCRTLHRTAPTARRVRRVFGRPGPPMPPPPPSPAPHRRTTSPDDAHHACHIRYTAPTYRVKHRLRGTCRGVPDGFVLLPAAL